SSTKSRSDPGSGTSGTGASIPKPSGTFSRCGPGSTGSSSLKTSTGWLVQIPTSSISHISPEPPPSDPSSVSQSIAEPIHYSGVLSTDPVACKRLNWYLQSGPTYQGGDERCLSFPLLPLPRPGSWAWTGSNAWTSTGSASIASIELDARWKRTTSALCCCSRRPTSVM